MGPSKKGKAMNAADAAGEVSVGVVDGVVGGWCC